MSQLGSSLGGGGQMVTEPHNQMTNSATGQRQRRLHDDHQHNQLSLDLHTELGDEPQMLSSRSWHWIPPGQSFWEEEEDSLQAKQAALDYTWDSQNHCVIN